MKGSKLYIKITFSYSNLLLNYGLKVSEYTPKRGKKDENNQG
jgi:hypothetical protein